MPRFGFRRISAIGLAGILCLGSQVADAEEPAWEMSLQLAAGTETVADGVARSQATSVVGGGDSLAAINHLGLGPRIDHLSTGGGASLEYVQGLELPGVKALTR